MRTEIAFVSVLVFMFLSFLLGMFMMKLTNGKGFSLKKSDFTPIERGWGVTITIIFIVLMWSSIIWLIPYLAH